jgi:DHA1 family inner membrane transport protein
MYKQKISYLFKEYLMQNDKLVQRNIWVSSGVLSISLLGDALLYVVLPVNADAFGVSMMAVGFLLAINRIIRTFTYGFIVTVSRSIGAKKLAVTAASLATISTLGYGLVDGVFLLSLSRIAWGLSYAGLLIVTLHYAAINPSKTGARIGISRSVEQIGPLVVMALGTWAVSYVGPQHVFLYIGLLSILGAIFAVFLVELNEPKEPPNFRLNKFFIPKPRSIDSLIFWMGFGIDGVFTVTISLMWVQYSSPETAIVIGGLILAARRISEMVIAPISGKISDNFGTLPPLLSMLLLCGVGFFLIGIGNLILGSIALVVCRGALGTLFPAAASKLYPGDAMTALTRNQTWRDIGAAAGPLLTGVMLGLISAELIHLLVFGLFMMTSIRFFLSNDFRLLSV